MTITELRDAIAYVRDVLETIIPADRTDALSEDEARQVDEGLAFIESRSAELAALEEREARLAAVRSASPAQRQSPITAPNANVRTGEDVFDLSGLSFMTPPSELRARAHIAIERASDSSGLSDDHRNRAAEILSRSDASGHLARRILATGSDAYRSGFAKMAGGQAMLMTEEERQAFARAQSLTNSAGGFAIPFTLDPTIIMTNDGAANPFRGVARIETITTDTWNGISSAGVTGGYAAEGSEVGDDGAILAQPSVKPERWDTFVPFSFEIGQDWRNIEDDVRMMIDERRNEFDVVAFTTGSGTNEPTGIVTALAAFNSGSSLVAPATAETFAVADVYAVTETLPPKYRQSGRAAWMMALPTLNDIRQFAADDGHALLARLGDGDPQAVLGYRALENSAMDDSSTINTGATAANYILLLGDFRQFLVVDRAGMNFELVPHLFATANNRPSGQRGFLAWGRTGAGLLNGNAFRMLNVATTA